MCYCGKTNSYETCCGRFIDGDETASTAEELMRSRYSAFARKNAEYLYSTDDPQTRSPMDSAANMDFANSVEFTGLEVISAEQSGNKAKVEFIAHYKDLKTGELKKHHELSQFRQQAGIWYYRQGKMKS